MTLCGTHGAIARTIASTATVRMPGPAGLASAEITRTIDGGGDLRAGRIRHMEADGFSGANREAISHSQQAGSW